MSNESSFETAKKWAPATVLFAVGVALGVVQIGSNIGSAKTKGDAEAELRARPVETAPLRAAANAAWAMGTGEAASRMTKLELSELKSSSPERRARLMIRLGLLSPHPEAQAATFSDACSLQPEICGKLKSVATEEADARFVAPGNHLPPTMLEGHPAIPLPSTIQTHGRFPDGKGILNPHGGMNPHRGMNPHGAAKPRPVPSGDADKLPTSP